MAQTATTPAADIPLEGLEQRPEGARKRHRTTTDSLLYNGSTVLVLLFTGAASLLPTIFPNNPHFQVTAQILAALAAFAVAPRQSAERSVELPLSRGSDDL